jgi:A-kinase anchor protein 1
MAPSHSRQLLIWTIPTIAVIFSYFWYRRKRIESKSDPGDTLKCTTAVTPPPKTETDSEHTFTSRTFSRSLSGVESAPIDIPPKQKTAKPSPVIISDEDLDLEIEKIKSMRYGGSIDIRKSNSSSESTADKQASSVNKQSSSIMAQKVTEERAPLVPTENVKMEKSPVNSDDIQRQNSERDSANHSPADVMMASPTLSSISDNQSEGSNDSGKGGSDVVTPPPARSLDVESTTAINIFEFIIPQSLVGKLIGKHGSSVTNIKDKTGAHVVVRKHPSNNKLKVCSVEGTQNEIDSALKLIRDKFPIKRYPEVTLEQISFLPQVSTVSLVPDHLYLKLIEGINNDTIVSCIMAPNHLFLQQPTHPTFPNLNILSSFMNTCYSETDSPLLPTPIPENTICVAFSGDCWYRAVILTEDQTNGTCYVKFLDYGGYGYIDKSKLRQIRADFMLLPFQAAECLLANVKPVGESGWREEAYSGVAEMTKGAIVFTQVVDYTDEGIPLVYCYLILGPTQVLFLNQELVNQGHAEWISDGNEASGVTVA